MHSFHDLNTEKCPGKTSAWLQDPSNVFKRLLSSINSEMRQLLSLPVLVTAGGGTTHLNHDVGVEDVRREEHPEDIVHEEPHEQQRGHLEAGQAHEGDEGDAQAHAHCWRGREGEGYVMMWSGKTAPLANTAALTHRPSAASGPSSPSLTVHQQPVARHHPHSPSISSQWPVITQTQTMVTEKQNDRISAPVNRPHTPNDILNKQ